MHAKIAEFPSKSLYDSSLISHPSVQSHLLKDLPGTSTDAGVISELLDAPVVFFDTAGCEYYERLQEDDGENTGKRGSSLDEGSRCNENEAAIVKNWVEKLVRSYLPGSLGFPACLMLRCCMGQVNAGVLPSQIAVITPYVFESHRPIHGSFRCL